jgi:hypothetical protein
VIKFNNTSADFVLISADVILKIITILKELKIAQLCSKNGRTLISGSIFDEAVKLGKATWNAYNRRGWLIL